MPPEFSSPRPNVYVGDTGFSVEILGRAGLRYAESGKVMIIDSEVLALPGHMALFRESITRWEAPHEEEPVHEVDRQRIIANIGGAFRSQGFVLEVL